jgi:hypothetical protein
MLTCRSWQDVPGLRIMNLWKAEQVKRSIGADRIEAGRGPGETFWAEAKKKVVQSLIVHFQATQHFRNR